MRYAVNIVTPLSFAAIASPVAAADRIVERRVVPARADPATRRLYTPTVALTDARLLLDASLPVFTSGTGGWPKNTVDTMKAIEARDDPAP